MSTTMTARVIVEQPDTVATHVDYYVRAVRCGPLFDEGQDRDGWAAYSEAPEWLDVGTERKCFLSVERISTAPRDTPEQAREDMRAAIRLHLEKPHTRLAHGRIEE